MAFSEQEDEQRLRASAGELGSLNLRGDEPPDGKEVGTHEQPLLWRPMIYHYGRNWVVPSDGEYTLRVRVEPPTFMRHDEINGKRFTEPVEVEFRGVQVERGQD